MALTLCVKNYKSSGSSEHLSTVQPKYKGSSTYKVTSSLPLEYLEIKFRR